MFPFYLFSDIVIDVNYIKESAFHILFFQVYCRIGVTRKCPEGLAWKNIDTPDDKAVVQLSVGPTGIVWAITWDGFCAARVGVSRDNPVGKLK